MNVRESLGGDFYRLYRRRRLRRNLGPLAVLAAPTPARDLGGQIGWASPWTASKMVRLNGSGTSGRITPDCTSTSSCFPFKFTEITFKAGEALALWQSGQPG
jgi:hypothetical protein